MEFNPKLDAALEALREDMTDTLARWVRIPSVRAEQSAQNAPFGAQVRQALEADPNAQKREYCVVFRWEAQDLAPPEPAPELGLEARLMDGLARGMSLRESMEALVASGERKNAVYAASLRLKALCAELAQQAPGEKSGA